jgi:DNA-binding NtrC family response regulator
VAHASPRKLERGQVLIVDREGDEVERLAIALRRFVSVDVCPDGVEAQERLRAAPYVAVIAEQNLPGATGLEVLQKTGQWSPDALRILVSQPPCDDTFARAVTRGVADYALTKPLELEEVVQLVSRLLVRSLPPSGQRAMIVGSGDAAAIRPLVESAGFVVQRVPTVDDAVWKRDREGPFDVVIWETVSSERVFDDLAQLRSAYAGAAIVCIEGSGDKARAGRLLAQGADDVALRPLRDDELGVRVRRAVERRRLIAEAQHARRAAPPSGLRELLGRSPAMLELFRTIEQVGPTDASILIRGETGTGKELVARVVHALSQRKDMPFVAVNCAAIPEGLVESELFGHERGAFTGAIARRQGRFELASGGTLFVDEVGDLPLAAQVKVLRVLQERTFERVGSSETVRSDIRLIAATHRDLEQLIEDGSFRRDLFYRLNVVPLYVAPLRERPEDIWLLVEHYVGILQHRMHKEGLSFSARMRQAMEAYEWPGNVRELINVVERAVALTPAGGVADFVTFREHERSSQKMRAVRPVEANGGRSLRDMVDAYERSVLEDMLARTGGNKTRAAKELGLTRQGLSLKLSKYRM